MTLVRSGLFLGSREDARRLAHSNPGGIRTVIAVTGETPVCQGKGIRYVPIAVLDNVAIPAMTFASVMRAIEEGQQRGPTLVCCALGISRSPSLVAAYLHHTGFLGFEDAILYLQSLRPCVSPSPVLVESIKQHLSTQSRNRRL